LVELAFQCIFPAKEIEKERGVVVEEIKSYKDSPSELIYDEFDEKIFEGTPLSVPVLGTAATLKRITRDDVVEYYNTMFVPENMVYTVVADIPCEKVVSIIEKQIEKYGSRGGNVVVPDENVVPEPLPKVVPFEKRVSRKSHQAHCIIGARAYSFYDSKRIPLILLINYLGGPAANSKLNMLLREKHALVYNVDASYAQYCDAGVVTIYFGCDKSNVERCEELIMKQINDLIANPLSDKKLKEAKKQLLGQLAISSDNGEAQVLSMGKSEMVFGRVIEMEQTRELLEKITSEELSEVAREVFGNGNISKLYYL
jgi:predicted Zn-dependent peptidase